MARRKKKDLELLTDIPPVVEPTNVVEPPAAALEIDEPLCVRCKHYKPLGSVEEGIGYCRRFPPIITVPALNLTTHGPCGIFPITAATSQCGEFTSALPLD